MIKKLTILAIIFSLFSLTACSNKKQLDMLTKIKENDYITIGVKYDTKPFGYMSEKQELKGFEIDLAKEITKRLLGSDKKVQFQQVTPSNRILSITSGELDMVIATMSITEKRKKIIDFSTPYFKTGLGFLVSKNSNILNVASLKNEKIILILGTTAEKDIKALLPNAKILGFRTYTDGYTALKASRAKAMATDKSILLGIVANDKNFKLLPDTYTSEYYGIALKKGKQNEAFLKEVNKILLQIEKDGTLKKLRQKWNLDNV